VVVEAPAAGGANGIAVLGRNIDLAEKHGFEAGEAHERLFPAARGVIPG
jgi:hypothetical protein